MTGDAVPVFMTGDAVPVFMMGDAVPGFMTGDAVPGFMPRRRRNGGSYGDDVPRPDAVPGFIRPTPYWRRRHTATPYRATAYRGSCERRDRECETRYRCSLQAWLREGTTAVQPSGSHSRSGMRGTRAIADASQSTARAEWA